MSAGDARGRRTPPAEGAPADPAGAGAADAAEAAPADAASESAGRAGGAAPLGEAGGSAPPAAAAPATEEEVAETRRGLQATAGIGVLMVLFAVLALADAARLGNGGGLLGAASFPVLVAVLMIAVGGGLIGTALLRLRTAGPAPAAVPGGPVRLAGLVGALVAFALALPHAGFTLSAALLFTASALLMGAPHPVRTAAYGWTLAGLLYLLFDTAIGLSLPGGPWGF
ncbi:tripartite tricarboxylate transporter TctB family protein [Nocardiopsis coralliicola]